MKRRGLSSRLQRFALPLFSKRALPRALCGKCRGLQPPEAAAPFFAARSACAYLLSCTFLRTRQNANMDGCAFFVRTEKR